VWSSADLPQFSAGAGWRPGAHFEFILEGTEFQVRHHVRHQIGSFIPAAAALLIAGALTCGLAAAQERPKVGPTPSPPGAEVYFEELKDGATIPSKSTIRFGLREMGVAPAGSDRPNAGHHHLLIDTELPPLDQPVPNDFNHLHFGNGQTEAEVSLKPGSHTLQLLFADKDHIPHNPPVMSALIHVTVSDAKPAPAATPAPPAKRQRAQTAERPAPRARPPYRWHPGIYYNPRNRPY
jgi:hypothetical protein